LATFDKVRLDGEAIPTGEAIIPGALGLGGLGIGTITSVTPGNAQNIIDATEVVGATAYDLYWKTSAGVAKTDNKITGVTFPHTHLELSNGTEYFYAYAARNAEEESELSNEVSGTPNELPPNTPLLFAVRA
jgi:hypothetical protein